MDVHSLSDDLILKVFDEDMTSDDFVGKGIIKVSSLVINGGVDDWFEITYKERRAGTVHLASKYHGPATAVVLNPSYS